MSEEEIKKFKDYIMEQRCLTNGLVNSYITGYALEQYKKECEPENFEEYEYDLFGNYNVLGAIDKLQQENTQLKQENQQLKDKMNFSYHIRNDTTSIPAVVRKANDVELIKKLQQENTQLKSVLKEIREYVKEYIREDSEYKNYMEMEKEKYNELLEIIDKGLNGNE